MCVVVCMYACLYIRLLHTYIYIYIYLLMIACLHMRICSRWAPYKRRHQLYLFWTFVVCARSHVYACAHMCACMFHQNTSCIYAETNMHPAMHTTCTNSPSNSSWFHTYTYTHNPHTKQFRVLTPPPCGKLAGYKYARIRTRPEVSLWCPNDGSWLKVHHI